MKLEHWQEGLLRGEIKLAASPRGGLMWVPTTNAEKRALRWDLDVLEEIRKEECKT